MSPLVLVLRLAGGIRTPPQVTELVQKLTLVEHFSVRAASLPTIVDIDAEAGCGQCQ